MTITPNYLLLDKWNTYNQYEKYDQNKTRYTKAFVIQNSQLTAAWPTT